MAHLLIHPMVVACYTALSVSNCGISRMSQCHMRRCHPTLPPLSCSQNPMPYQTGPLRPNGMCHRIPVVPFWDHPPLGDALVGPSPGSHDKHTNPEVYLCQAAHASPHGLVLCFGCGSLSHPLGILPAFVLVVS